ncbi:ATP-binding cassette domain-containing protein [Paracidovorax oryzae]|uniref:ATP-binding cassette domain-containing protein n=1 Tax=Paracidovorax oryzae TaxID=862720 RepID=UPI00031B30FB|nr:ATP-binding cassette domain-containing protein [Paracidovorax oryzae]
MTTIQTPEITPVQTCAEAVLSVRGLGIALPDAADRSHAVRDLSFELRRGQTLCLVGESGSGKSMTALALMGLLGPALRVETGQALFEGQNLLALPERARRRLSGRRIAMIFQEPMASLNPAQRIETQVAEVFRLHTDLPRAEVRARVLRLAGAPAAAPAPAEDTAAAPGAKPAPAPAPHPTYKAELPADYEDKVAANKAALTDLRMRFDNGEVDAAEYHAKLDELQEQRADLREAKTRAQVASEMQEQAEAGAWLSAINTFVADAATKPELGLVDYAKDQAKAADLDVFVKALAAAPENAAKPHRWFLEEGHRRVVALHGIATAKPAAAAPTTRKPDASAVVTNLADLPGGGGDADPVGDEFAELDKLTGLDYERELGRLSPEKRERYLRG